MNRTTSEIPKVLFVAIGDIKRASSRLRAFNWLPYLKREGIEAKVASYFQPRVSEIYPRLPQPAAAMLRRIDIWTRVLPEISRLSRWADVIFLQEVLLPKRLLHQFGSSGKRVIFDFSDPVHLANPQSDFITQQTDKLFRIPLLDETLRVSSAVGVENDLLLEVAKPYRLAEYVMRGPIDTNIFVPREQKPSGSSVVIGWTGGSGTYPYLEPLLPVISRLGREYPNLQLKLFGIPFTPQVLDIKVESLGYSQDKEPNYVANFDIAINYHPETYWTRARGGAKLLVYMAAGVPIVSSHFGIGDQVIRPGENGFLASNEEEWYRTLKLLIEDSSLRARLAGKARQEAVTCHSYEAYLPLMLQLIRGELSPGPLQNPATSQQRS